MPENIHNIPGALPPKPAESAKVQPKKETVRINLPPKPTSAPTIKLPTLPTGAGPSSASAPTAASVPSVAIPGASAAPAPPKPPSVPASLAPATRVAGGSPNRPGAPPSASHAATVAPRAMAPVASVSNLDKGLAVFAVIISLGVLGIAAYLAFMLTNGQPGAGV